MVFPILGSGDSSSGYDIENSLRFDDITAHFQRTPGSAGNRQIFTISMWLKICSAGKDTAGHHIFYVNNPSDTTTWGGFYLNTDKLHFYAEASGSGHYSLIPNRKFKDPSAWYHIVIAVDTTQNTSSDRIKFYVNGVQETSFGTANYPSQNDNTVFNNSGPHALGAYNPGTNYPPGAGLNMFDGHLAEVYMIDGTQLAPTSFGEFDNDSGIWKPIEYAGSYGTNGFFLEFKQTGTSANASGKGADTSGEDNHWDDNGMSVFDQTTDTPTNNFATFNSLHPSVGNPSNQTPLVYSEGNTKVVGQTSGVAYSFAISTIAVSSGKWYYEFYRPDTDSGTVIAGAQNPGLYNTHGSHSIATSNNGGVGVRASNGELYQDGSYESVANATQWPDAGDILSVKLNMDDDEISFSTNGASYTAAQSLSSNVLASGLVAPGANIGDDEELTVNLGNPNWALSSGNADANGYGNFEYAVPANYYAICTKNLAKYGG